jgi:hypothetical protein
VAFDRRQFRADFCILAQRMPTNARVRRCSVGDDVIRQEYAMKGLLFCLAAGAAVIAATPAGAQFWFDAGPVGVRVGPPPPWHHRHRVVEDYAYVVPAECRIIKERIRRANGTRVIRERRICD